MATAYADPVSRLFGIIGHPLGHSLSPLIHNAEFGRLTLPHLFMRWELTPDRLDDFMRGMRVMGIGGLSVTIPHKQAVIAHLDQVDDLARRIGAVNTVREQDGMLLGMNTDIIGFLSPLKALDRTLCSALVLGAGGAARAALVGLQEMGVELVMVSNRTEHKARQLANEFGVKSVPWEERGSTGPELVVNSTPLGMSGRFQDQSPWPEQAFDPDMIAYDLVYNPLKTLFLRQAGAAGCSVVDGLSMFIGQAAAQFSIWTGREMDTRATRTLLLEYFAA